MYSGFAPAITALIATPRSLHSNLAAHLAATTSLPSGWSLQHLRTASRVGGMIEGHRSSAACGNAPGSPSGATIATFPRIRFDDVVSPSPVRSASAVDDA